ncbi:PREDICTED: transposon, partial [Prunus dulcis]
EAEDDDSVEEAEDDDSETDIELIDSEFEQSDEEGLKTVLEEDDNLFDKHVVDEENDEYNEEPGEVDSEDYNTDDLVSLDEESDEGEGVKNRSRRRKAPRFKQFRRESDLLKPTFHLGMEFTNMEQCREAIRYYAVSCARPLKWVRNDSNRVRLKCEGDKKQKVPCPWMLYASHVGKGPSTRIKTYVPRHTCGRRQRTKYATSSWLSKRFDEELRDNPKMKVTDFMKLIRKHYAIDVTEAQVYKAKSFAKKRIQGSIEEQYGKLWDYCEELKSNNPGSTVIVKTELQGENPIFKRIYVCFGALKKGFVEGCRPVVGFDGCHVKGSHPGQILSAVGIDGNNGMYPIAFAVVEVENTETWGWFFDIFFQDVGIENGNGWVFITDKQKGLGNALHALMPNAEHRHCVRHLHNNFKLAGHTGAAFKQRLWAAARATTIPVFEAEMEQMLGQSQAAYKWLQERAAAHWSRSHFSTVPKCDILLNNLCECFNAAILEARDKPIVTLLERIRTYLMLRMARLRETVWPHEVGPRIFGIVEKNSIESGHCIALYAGGGKYQVNSMLGAMFVVDLERHTCTCRKWDLSGIPCPHALASIAKSEHSPLDFVHALYKRPAYDRAYEGYISPMPSQAYWRKTGHVPIKPPVYRIQPGRPKLSRNREADEIPKGATKLKRYGIVMTCRNCGQE